MLFIITDEQIRQLALNIVYDVRLYVKEHPKEYQEFIEEDIALSQNSIQSSLKGGDKLDENEFKTNQGDSKLEIKGPSIQSANGCGEA